jgi:hypothetical protein
MSKVIISPIERYKGSVTIADPITIPQAQAVEAGMTKPESGEDGRVWLSVIDTMQLPAVIACVEKWELTNIPDNPTAENFPASPRKDSHKLVEWIFSEIQKVYFGELDIPFESSPTPSDMPQVTGEVQS